MAQTPDTIATQRIDEVTVKAVRLPQQVMAPVPVQAFSGEQIEKLGFQNMADAVRRFAGTTVCDYGGIGGLKTVSVRSLGPHHTGVAYDKVAVSNCQAGQIDIGRFSLDNVAVLSLAVGQEDNLLQSARLYASGAVLGIQTETPTFRPQREFSLQAHLRGGSFGLLNPYLRWNQKLTSSTRLSIDGDFMRADGTYPFILKNGKLRTNEKRYNSDILSWRSEANLYHTFKDEATLQVKAYYFNSERGLPGAVILYVQGNNERLWDENFFAQAHYEKSFNEKWQMQAQLKYTYGWNKYQDKDPMYEGGKQVNINRQNEYYASSTVRFQPSRWLTFSLAQDAVVNTLTNNFKEHIAPIRWTSLTALNMKLSYRNFTLIGGLLNTFTRNKEEKDKAAKERNKLTPSLSLTYQPLGGQNLNIRMHYKKSYRLPSFNDLYYFRIGNPDILPERADEYNLGIGWNKTTSSFVDYFMINADAFYNKVEDKIVVFPTTYISRMVNFGRVDIKGIDVSAMANVALNKQLSLTFTGGYTYQQAVDLTDSQGKTYKEQIPYTPLHSGNGSVSFNSPWGTLSYSFVGVGTRYTEAQHIAANKIDRYCDQNLAYTKTFKRKSFDWTIYLESINLMNKQYEVIKCYPMPGRSFRATIKIKL